MATITEQATSSSVKRSTSPVQPPVRPPDTLGVVVERRRPPGEHEHVIFYCDNCGALVEDIDFDCGDIVEHFSQAMLDFWNDDARRTCKKCGRKVPQPEAVKPF